MAANDDAPSIGGLIYALNQKPSNQPFMVALIASGVWAVLTIGYAIAFFSPDPGKAVGVAGFLTRFESLTFLATLTGPIGLAWLFAYMIWRTEELRLRSSAMTEVAVRLAEPDRMAEQSVAALGQAVRRQVSFMNDAVSRALGRAGELEALVHNEVTALERSYEENERRIRGLIQELASERSALLNTSGQVSDTLKSLGTEVPTLIDKLTNQQVKLAHIIEGAGQNLTALETAIATQAGQLESTIATRTDNLQSVFEEYTRALDTTFASRTENLDAQLVARTKALDQAFSDRLQLFDESIMRSALMIDGTVTEKATVLTSTLESHAKTLSDSLGRHAVDMDDTLMRGISAVRRTSENITRQSIKAIEGLAGQSDVLKRVSENLLSQIHSVTNRFEDQGHNILRAADALESANYRIDRTLQSRHAEIGQSINQLAGRTDELGNVLQGYSTQLEGTMSEAERRARVRTDELGNVLQGYSTQLEGTMSEAERRARLLTSELTQTAEERSRATLAEIERLKTAASDNTDRALDDLRSQFSNVSREVTTSVGSLSSDVRQHVGSLQSDFREHMGTLQSDIHQHMGSFSSDLRQRAAELEAEQERLRAQIASLPVTTREGSEAMRRAMQDQLRALEQLSSLTSREANVRDVSRPAAPLRPMGSLPPPDRNPHRMQSLTSALAQELHARNRAAMPSNQIAAALEGNNREGWSVGDLLARASQGDEHASHAGDAPGGAGGAPSAQLDIAAMAAAIEPPMAADIWTRLGSGEHGIMMRNIYSAEARALFDDVCHRLATDQGFQNAVHGYIADFERLLQDSEQQDPSGRTAQGHLVSDVGRVYLFLGHATGRIS